MSSIAAITGSRPTLEGAGVHLYRAFGFNESPSFDPFLLLDDFRSDIPGQYLKGFPWHPHRGIETITYMLRGEVEHGDSMGNEGVITAGGVQWMTAGSGIIHQEMPKGDPDGSMHGFQLWANLPASQKMMPPRYREIRPESIPEVLLDNGVLIKVIAGESAGIEGPVRDIVIDPRFIDCTVPEGETYTHQLESGYTGIIYLIGGSGLVDGQEIENRTLVRFVRGAEITVAANSNGVRFLLFSAKPLEEPVAWRGPIVMNTREELGQAFREYHAGTFIRHGPAEG